MSEKANFEERKHDVSSKVNCYCRKTKALPENAFRGLPVR